MKKEIISILLVGGMVTGLNAGGDLGGVIPVQLENVDVPIEEVVIPVIPEVILPEVVVPPEVIVEEVKPEVKEEPKVVVKPSANYYVVLKGLSIAGDTLGLNDADRGYGAGLDLGYKFANGFAVELGTTYAKNQLNNTAGTDVSYKTGAIDLVYDFDLSEKLDLFAKGGYLYEKPSIGDSEKGLVYGAGLAYKISDNKSIVGEYEISTLDSLRGDAISLGLMINF
jgi:hypothetical protein